MIMFKMEGMMKKHICVANTTPSSAAAAALAMHKDSQTRSKLVKPKIRIIHIFAPEIIKTDVANFRELVQRLTGKPTESNTCTKKKKKNIPRIPRKEEPRRALNLLCNKKPAGLGLTRKMELQTGFRSSLELRERIKGEEEMWDGENPISTSSSGGGGFLGGFADLDGFVQELNEFPLFASSSHMDSLGEAAQLA